MKERPFPLSEAAPAALTDNSLLRRLRRPEAWVLALALLAAGCPQPADLENPESFCKPGASVVDAQGNVTGCGDTPSGGGSAGGGPMACETACMTQLFNTSCIGCHFKVAPLGGLDLESANYTSRLKDQPAKHESVDNPAQCPTGDKLVDSASPMESWLLKKISGQQGMCGGQMPSANMPVSQADLSCVTAYVNCLGGGV